jgi:vacuolar-type H+-ATPase subunit F/Vma7
MPFHVVADEDTVIGFRHAGVEGTVVEKPEEAARELDRLAEEGGQTVVITTEQIANAIREKVNDIRYGGAFPPDCGDTRAGGAEPREPVPAEDDP